MADSQDIKRNGAPWWAQMLFATAMAAIAGGVSYGALGARVDAIHSEVRDLDHRIDKLETKQDEREKDVYKALTDMRNAIGGVQLDVARILTLLKR